MKKLITSSIVLIFISSLSFALMANQNTGKRDKYASSYELNGFSYSTWKDYHGIEAWMTDTGYFTSSTMVDANEAEIGISGWMYDPYHFVNVVFHQQKESSAGIEEWMSNPSNFQHNGYTLLNRSKTL